MSFEVRRERADRHGADEHCPVCGSPVHGDDTASGIGIHFCSRCTWYRVRSADGNVAEEDSTRRSAAAA